jgi:tetratricopeptide (TPR) repeat protein
MFEPATFPKTAFKETLLGLQYEQHADRAADLFSRACVEEYEGLALTRYGYCLAQVFEPAVLREVALVEGRSYAALADLSERPTPAMEHVGDLVEHAEELVVAGLVNLASALISVSRFDPAERLLGLASARAADGRERFEIALLQFIIANRRDDGAGSPHAFRAMREAIATGAVPPDRVLDACSQAVVWYMKRRELPREEYEWYVARGCALAKQPELLDPGSISAWYRALAMVPASRGEAARTRQFMQWASEAAEATFARRPRAYEQHYVKTYLESSIKEHMFVTRDRDAAEEAGRALIALDPAWGPSYAELADAYTRFGELEGAAKLYDQAVWAGPPYLGNHLMAAARCHQKLGNAERALAHYETLAHYAPDNEAVLVAGLENARRVSSDSAGTFERSLERLATGGRRGDGAGARGPERCDTPA